MTDGSLGMHGAGSIAARGPRQTTGLTKSSYITGMQCEKTLWLRRNRPELEIDTRDAARAAQGDEVGALARRYYGESVTVFSALPPLERVQLTAQLMSAGVAVICEATFVQDGDLCMVDLLRRDHDGWAIIEVKSSVDHGDDDLAAPDSTFSRHLDDIAFQYAVVSGSGIPVISAALMRINGSYLADGDGEPDLQRLFAVLNVTSAVIDRQPAVVADIAKLRTTLSSAHEPVRSVGSHCTKPYGCGFQQYCWEDMPKPNVFDLPRIKGRVAEEFHAEGLSGFPELLGAGARLNPKQLTVVQHHVERRPPHVDRDAIQSFLDQLTYPVHFLDFETFAEAVPRWAGVKPYQQVPFQYSVHVQQAPFAEPEHFEFLAREGSDPRRAVADSLVRHIPADATVLAWNKGFERGRLQELAARFPDLAEHLLGIRDWVLDLGEPFSRMDYYDAGFGGSWSIKRVLPVLYPDDPDLDYGALDLIHNGGEASERFRTLHRVADADEREAVRASLRAYRRLDTLATVKILDFLQRLVADPAVRDGQRS